MSRAHCAVAAGLLSISLLLGGCIKPTTLNPYANPGRDELDRLQKIVNGRPDLERVERQLAELDAAIRAAIAKYSPQTQFSSTAIIHPTKGCKDPFNRTIGKQEESDHFFGEPAPNNEQWVQIVTELAPVFSAAGFRSNDSAPAVPPKTGAPNDSQIRDDGALINLVNHGKLVDYNYDTGCRLPAAWRTAPPPPDMRPANDPNVHYPYLYGPPGGRNVDAY
ncbi:LppA family lipoprotein [Mycobacterium riyadhense]|uniref:Lipoprotein LprP n=1 Tax=Mycobacterium riyadhense TaxID=486698 RepID=A0A1X2BC49_9MYCO|nr:LppA family lipoprotein [Mycobacterium riyadhense]MCV7145843.1 hypothetical protein [Mycobacterium riyadhense]ORW61134.1 hypothetical protein AWC22_05345 [Mycobacterium riyadhense]VTO97688.1 hypothetical protein BIN_B_02211 [Mycobacterium riyadhense]